MGWMTTYKDPKESAADFLKRECLTWSLPLEAHPQVIASATGSSCIAFAVRFPAAYWDRRSPPQRTFIPNRDGSVTTALIFLTNSGERGSRSYNFGYKDMDETMCPCEPVAASILRHLSALDLENGGEVAKWAQACATAARPTAPPARADPPSKRAVASRSLRRFRSGAVSRRRNLSPSGPRGAGAGASYFATSRAAQSAASPPAISTEPRSPPDRRSIILPLIKEHEPMSTTNPHRAVAAPKTADDDAYAAMCVWEEMLAIKAKDDSEPDGLLNIWERIGRRQMREKAFELGKLANAVWAALDDDAHDMFVPFDWEFVPAFLRTIVFESADLTLPRIETAVETMQAKAAERAAEQRAKFASKIGEAS